MVSDQKVGVMSISNKYQGQTGPKTSAGKNRSKFNALKTGMHAKSKTLPYEDRQEYERHMQSVMSGLDPQDLLQANLAQQIGDSLWRGNRQEIRASLHREHIFNALTPKMMAKLLGIEGDRQECAPGFLVDPNHRFGRAALKLHRDLYSHFQHWESNSKGVANYQMVWRQHGDLFIHLGSWMKSQIKPDLLMANGQGLNLAWQQHPRELEKYLIAYGHYLWYVVHFEEMRNSIRTWMATWYFVNNRHAEDTDHFDEIMIKERRVCQGLLDSYFKCRKSQIEFSMMRHTELVVQKPNPLKGMQIVDAPENASNARSEEEKLSEEGTA